MHPLEEQFSLDLVKKFTGINDILWHRVENKVNSGTSDVFWSSRITGCHGWIELKVIVCKRDSKSTTLLKHLTSLQKFFLSFPNGNSFLFVKVFLDDDVFYYLVPESRIKDIVNLNPSIWEQKINNLIVFTEEEYENFGIVTNLLHREF